MKNPSVYGIMGVAAVCLAAAGSAGAGTLECPPDSVKVGNVCVDTYEASVWQIPPSNTALVKLVQAGKATLAELSAGGATLLGCTGPQYPANFPIDGNWTPVAGSNPPSPGIYAVSVSGVRPTDCISWFRANQACLLSGKRLLTNREWQGAAAGTPDPGTDNLTTDCAVNSPQPVDTGSRSNCKSAWGVFDMVGNVSEWVADWSDLASNCTDWTTAGIPGSDRSCFGGAGGAGDSSLPSALVRGGAFSSGTSAGVFSVDAEFAASMAGESGLGFRCAR